MDDRIAIITGAGRGIGRATAQELARQHYKLALVARTQSDLDETARLCPGAAVIPADVSDPNDVAHVVRGTIDRFGRVDALVHAAGVAPLVPVEQLSLEQWRSTIDTNLSAIFYFCRLLWPIWRSQDGGGGGGGAVVNVSSYSARDPFPGFAAYGAAKAGVNLLGLALAKEGEAIGVRVHTVAPAATETAMFRRIMTPEQYAPANTLDPADVARVIVQCVCGDLRYTSGEVVYVHKTM